MSILPSQIKDTSSSCFIQSNLSTDSTNHGDSVSCSSSDDTQFHIPPDPLAQQSTHLGTIAAIGETSGATPETASGIRIYDGNFSSLALKESAELSSPPDYRNSDPINTKKDRSFTCASSGTKSSFGASHSSGRKPHATNANHLLNFSFDPIVRSHPRPPPARNLRRPKPYNKDLFLQANYKFVVLDTGNYSSEIVDPDKMLQWEYIVCLKYTTASHVQCPICLDNPLCPQITSCGHIFCFPCILQYLLTGRVNEASDSFKRCPLCFMMISVKDLYTIYIENVNEYKVGDTINFYLLSRAKDSLTPSRRQSNEEDQDDYCGDTFAKFSFTKDVNLSLRKAVSELDCWIAKADSGLVDDIEKLPFVSAAMTHLEQRKTYWNEHCVNDRYELKSKNDLASSPSTSGGLSHEKHSILKNSPESLDSRLSLVNIEDENELKDSYNFYQACDGQNIILHPLNMKCLLHHYGSYDLLPNRLRGKILQLESVSQSELTRKRYRYLSHFSLTTTYELCEISLNAIIPPHDLQPFADEIKKREKQRKALANKERKEKIKAEVAAAAAAADSLHVGRRSYSDTPQFSLDDFTALGNSTVSLSSSPTMAERTSFSDVTRLGYAAAHDSPSLRNDHNASDANVQNASVSRSMGVPSFANVIASSSSKTNSDKKGRKQNRVLLSTSSGRRY